MTGAVSCCSYDGNTCTRPSCLTTTYDQALEKCVANGMRLCTSTELAENKCCNKGWCDFDYKLNWYNDKG